ncbi:MAG: dihydropteroate synthase [Firmicutes bacterium]|nr:dihydropteroate synthase [Bacillota bacterium]
MILIGEEIQILSKVVSQAIKERDPAPLQDIAKRLTEAGADYIDLNIGPAKKEPDVMPWLVEVVQEVTDLPLALDTLNPVAMEKGLAVCKKRPLLNSASGRTDSKNNMMPLAVKYNCDVILSVLTDQGIPSDAGSSAEAIMETIDYANSIGIANESIWVDPIMMPIGVDQPRVVAMIEFFEMLEDIAPGVKSTLGLSNMSSGAPHHLRGILNRVMMVVLEKFGMYSAIVETFDGELVALARGQKPADVELIHRAIDEEINPADLPPHEAAIVKTVNVVTGKNLYSHSWLEI